MYAQNVRTTRSSRIIGGALAAALQLAIIVLVVTGLSPQIRSGVQTALTSLDLRTPPPKLPPKPQPPRHPAHAASGRSAPANIRSHAAAIVAPIVPVLKPPPVPVATVAGMGVQATAGAAPVTGSGSGAGGQGSGSGSGNSGDGEGDGGRDVELIAGRIRDSDVPRVLQDAPFSGTTSTEVVVNARGQVTACRVSRSSGNRMLDDLTCRLIFLRFRFRPALDAQGRPQGDEITYDQEWTVGGQFESDSR